MPTPITSALESKPDIPDGSVTGFLGTPAHKNRYIAGIFDLEFKHSVAEAFSALMKTQSFRSMAPSMRP
jgi:hypothetical protein